MLANALIVMDQEAGTSWKRCGRFPQNKVRNGCRACREGWRKGPKKWAVVCNEDSDLRLEVEILETDNKYCRAEPFELSNEDLAATDWYLEEVVNKVAVGESGPAPVFSWCQMEFTD